MSEVTARIVMTGHGRGEVFINGQKVENVKGFEMECEGGSLNRLTLTFVPSVIEVVGEFETTAIGSEAREFVAGKPTPAPFHPPMDSEKPL